MPAAIPIEINHGASGLIVSNHGARQLLVLAVTMH